MTSYSLASGAILHAVTSFKKSPQFFLPKYCVSRTWMSYEQAIYVAAFKLWPMKCKNWVVQAELASTVTSVSPVILNSFKSAVSSILLVTVVYYVVQRYRGPCGSRKEK